MVAAARLRRAEEKALGTRPYADKIQQVLRHIVASDVGLQSPLLEERPVTRTAYVIVGADKGLAGGYTSNLMKKTMDVLHGQAADAYALLTVGRKPYEYLTHRDYAVGEHYVGFSDRPTYNHAKEVARVVAEKFVAGEVDEVVLVYTHFYSALRQKPTTQRLLPIAAEADAETAPADVRYRFLPNVQDVFERLLPQYLEIVIYNAMLQAAASELGSRMAAMTSATDNASDLIDDLTLYYNKARQAAITSEITEIVGGANALE